MALLCNDGTQGEVRINILFVASSIGGGGAERVAVNLVAEMLKLGHKVSLFYWDDKGAENYPVDPGANLCRAPQRLLPLRILNLSAMIRREKVDVVFSVADMANISTWLALFFMSKPPIFISGVHSDLQVRDAASGLSPKTHLLRWLHKRASHDAAKVIAVSDGARASLIDYFGLDPESVVRIYNPVLSDATVHKARRDSSRPCKMIAAGRLTEAKNYALMIEAIRILVHDLNRVCELEIYGSGHLEDQLKTRIAECGLAKQVKLLGFVDHLSEKLAAADMFVQSSSWEGFGNVLVEALQKGLNVVATDCPSGPREILANGEFGLLVPPNNARLLAQAIAEVMAEPMVIDEVALQEHLSQFTITTVTQAYLDLAYQQIPT
ncbi:MAG: glycosyltransferase [bacterium]